MSRLSLALEQVHGGSSLRNSEFAERLRH
jgi:hypothetical protein